jgi:hypothetical protein
MSNDFEDALCAAKKVAISELAEHKRMEALKRQYMQNMMDTYKTKLGSIEADLTVIDDPAKPKRKRPMAAVEDTSWYGCGIVVVGRSYMDQEEVKKAAATLRSELDRAFQKYGV